ncbi:type VI secretion system domain-containing protein [Klebsiella pneumoniae]|nr:type VI secretion system domain-containing protein [Klebsiella pneumoniae]
MGRLPGLETLAFNDGTPFADEVTLNWINTACPGRDVQLAG